MLMVAVCGVLAAHAFSAHADDAAIAPPPGAALLLRVNGDGVQIYACEATDKGSAWVFKAPEAMLFDGDDRQIGTHYAGPTWKLDDGSTVVGEVAARADAPSQVDIPWLLLRAKAHNGAGTLSHAAYIRRIETQGGIALKSGCDAAHIGDQARMRYSAVYEFYAAPK